MSLKNNKLKLDDVKCSERPPRLEHRFLVLRKLGQGTYGKVQLALNKETNQEVAIKTIKKAKIEREEDMLRIRREIHIMASIRHPHIIHINEVFETRQKIVLVMQYASGGELYDYLGCHNTLPEKEARRIFRQIASAIYYCHKNNICHRDLKLENILLDEEGNAQIADFGLSNIFDESKRMNTFCGSPLYASPEIVKGIPYTGPEVDCWSMGVLLYILIYGRMPFDGKNFRELVSQISEGRYNEPICKSRASGLIRRLLTPEIAQRATISDVCENDWVNEGSDEPLYKTAEEMSAEALVKTNQLRLTKCLLDKSSEMENKKQPLRIESCDLEHKIGANSESISNEGSGNPTTKNNSQSRNPAHPVQLLNGNSSIVKNGQFAVESPKTEPCTALIPPSKEKIIPTFKSRPKNGENDIPTKVESAYVIPIFEVTSVIPKSKGKNLMKTNTEISQNYVTSHPFPNEHAISAVGKQSKKTERLNTKKNTSLNQSQQLALADTNSLCQNHAETTSQPPGKTLNSNQLSFCHNKNLGSKPLQVKDATNEDARIAPNRLKRTQKQFSPFFRSKNHSLSLARIFSMKYEELILKTFKVPERKQRAPGKIVIPATFDPSTSSNDFQDKKEIIVFPTVSVSENKERIEKKIDRIKKAALNMNLIRRSNTKNRLRIQKYLKSQAKKIQDLVHDENRSATSSIDNLNVCEMFSAVSDSYFNKFNLINIKHHNKKMNFMYFNTGSSYAINIHPTEKWKLSEYETTEFGQRNNLGLTGIVKSKSDIQFSPQFQSFTSNESCCRLNPSNDQTLSYTLNVPNDCQLFRSASYSESTFKTGPNIYVCDDLNINFETRVPDENVQNQHTLREYFTQEFEKLNDLLNLKMKHSKQSSVSANQNLSFVNKSDKPVQKGAYKRNEGKVKYNLMSTNSCTDYKKVEQLMSLRRFASTPSLSNREVGSEACKKREMFFDDPPRKTWTGENSYGLTSDVFKKLDRNQKLSRRNTISASSECNASKTFFSLDHTRRSSVDSDTGFEDYFWTLNDEQEYLLAQQSNQTKFLSSPNLCRLHVGNKTHNELVNESKSVDCLSIRERGRHKNRYETLAKEAPSCLQTSNVKSGFGRRIVESDDSAFYDYPTNNTDRTMSISQDTLAHFENDEILRRTQNERKLSLPPKISENQTKSPFLSKFLNDLENREHLPNTKNKTTHPLHRSKSSFSFKKRPEKRSQSFLQLLSLKRIQEAEKELERAERSNRIEIENDESGSLLEALKTHGYKGVIATLLQETDDDSFENLNLKNPKSSYFKRQTSLDMPYYSPMQYETLPFLPTLTYEDNFDIPDASTLKSFYELYPSYKQNYQKQLVYDWLTTNQNTDFLSQYKTEPDLIQEPERLKNTQPLESPSYWCKPRAAAFDEEATTSLETLKDQYTNGGINHESPRARENSLEDTDYAINNKFDRNVLSRTSSASEDEKESVQDRIWRKSFYSRFNSSILSRKQRPTFLNSQFSNEKRSGIKDKNSTAFSVPSYEGNDYITRNSYKDFDLQRIQGLTRSCTTNGFTAGSVKAKSNKHFPLRKTKTNNTFSDEDMDLNINR